MLKRKKEVRGLVRANKSVKDGHFLLYSFKGFTLIEAMVAITIIIVVLLAIYNLISQSLKIAQENKFKMSAIMIANQKIERLHNLPYSSLGTTAGIPSGPIPSNEVISDSRGTFNINTVINFVDDPFDGTFGGSPDDLLPNDYKVARIRVNWTGFFGIRQVTTFTYIAPRGVETDPGGGTLVVTVFNATGQPVNQADINIKNDLVAPAINADYQTATSGIVVIPGAPASIEGYEITVSKAGYSTSSTTARTLANPNPTQVNASVLDDQKTEVSFSIDLLSTLTLRTIEQDIPENWLINTDTSGENQTNARLTIDNSGNTYVVWQDFRNGSEAKIYAQKYNSSKVAQWVGDKVIGSANNQILPDIIMNNSESSLYISWSDNSNGNQDCYIVKLAANSGNDLWGGAKKIDTAADSKDQMKPRIALSGNDLIAVWQDNRNGNNDIYSLRYHNDHSVDWNEFRVNSDAGLTEQTDPAIGIDSSGNIYYAWSDSRTGNLDIYWSKFNSGGTRVWAADLLANATSTAAQYTPNIALDSLKNIYLTWADERNSNPDVYAQSYNASGTPLWTGDLRINSDTGSTTQNTPAIAINSADRIFIAWTDERNGNQDIYAQKLDTAGNKLWSGDIRINVNTDDSAQLIPDLTINPSSDRPVATWQDDRNNNMDIFATEFDSYGSVTNIPNLPLIITSAKRIGENPIIYKFNKSLATDGNGLLTLTGMEWGSYAITIASSSSYTIDMADPPIPANLLPDTTLQVNLYVED